MDSSTPWFFSIGATAVLPYRKTFERGDQISEARFSARNLPSCAVSATPCTIAKSPVTMSSTSARQSNSVAAAVLTPSATCGT
jgi:hypothetical protein